MLANLLPGIREIRGPLAAGYLWLLCAWLILDLPERSELTGPIERVVDGAAELPSTALFGVLSFAAYLIGSLSEDVFTRAITSFAGSVSALGVEISPRLERAATPTPAKRDRSTPVRPGEPVNPGSEAGPMNQVRAEIESHALQQEIGRLGNSIDRLESENTLRLALLPPVAVLAVYLGVAQNWLWFLALALVPAFVAQVVSRQSRIDSEAAERDTLIKTAEMQAAVSRRRLRLTSLTVGGGPISVTAGVQSRATIADESGAADTGPEPEQSRSHRAGDDD